MLWRDIQLVRKTGVRYHAQHISTAGSIKIIREAKQDGLPVTCEATPHHLLLTEECVETYDTNYKMNPPLRDESDRTALIEALADGTVDAIATDHAPHHSDEKCVEFALAPFGIVGLETAISLCLGLVHERAITLERMVELFTVGPARVLRLDKGTLAQGADADITVLDPDRELTLEAASFESKSANSPFLGWKVRGAPVMTLVGGRIVHDARAISP